MVYRLALPAAVVAAGVLLIAAPARAQTVINFDSLTAMSNNPGSVIPAASRISNQFQALGVLFGSGSGANFIAVVNLGEGGTPSPLNGVGGAATDDTLTYSGNPLIIARFVNPVDGVTPFATNSVSVRGDLVPAGGTITIRAFDVANTLLGAFSATDAGGTLLSLTLPNMNRIELTGTGDVAYDDFTFGPLFPAAGVSAPEPTSAALLGLTLAPLALLRAYRGRRR